METAAATISRIIGKTEKVDAETQIGGSEYEETLLNKLNHSKTKSKVLKGIMQQLKREIGLQKDIIEDKDKDIRQSRTRHAQDQQVIEEGIISLNIMKAEFMKL